MAKLNRVKLIRLICKKAGISQRKKPDSMYFSKPELFRISSYLDLACAAVKENAKRKQTE